MGTYRVAVNGLCQGQEIVNVFHIAAPPSDPTTVANGWVTYCQGAYLACLTNTYEINSVVATEIPSNLQFTATTSGAGGRAGDTLPLADCGVISWRTSLVGRKYRGRNYIGPLSETDQANGIASGSLQALLDSLADALLHSWPTGVGGNLVLYHRGDATITAITAYIVRAYLKIQRRRSIGVGA